MAIIFGTNGADSRDGTTAADVIHGGPSPNPATDTGNDTLWGGDGNDVLNGYGGNDSLDGGNDDDTLNGGDGNDILYGGSGINTASGGAGDDTLRADNIGTVAGFDGGAGTDTLLLDFTVTLAGSSVLNSVERVDRNGGNTIQGTNANDILNFGAIAGFDGATPSGLEIFGAGGNDSITGTVLGDTLGGGAENDTLNGGDGDDRLYGGSGTNTLLGGQGDDTLVADNLGTVGSFDGGAGTDTLFLGFTVTLAGTSVLTSVERVDTNGGQAIQGTNANNVLNFAGVAGFDGTTPTGLDLFGAGGNDTMTGTALGDTLDGGAGNDSLAGGLGDDTYVVDSAADALTDSGGNDTVVASLDWTLAAGFENLTLTGGANGTGNLAANRITGNAGPNVLAGLGGDDTLEGGLGDDRLLGGVRSDLLAGGDGNDTLDGGGGADTLVGGLGADRLVGDAGMDTIRYASAAEGGDQIIAFVAADDTIEVSAAGFGGDLAQGSLSANQLEANTSGRATTADARFIYDADSGRLWWDADGTGAEARTLLATLKGLPAITAADIHVIA